MTKGFADTTILVAVAEEVDPTQSRTKRFVAAEGPIDLPDYAKREFSVGKLQQVCDAHNRVLAAENPAEAIDSILSLAGFRPRTAVGTARAAAAALSEALRGDASRTTVEVKREVLQALRLKAGTLWRRAQRDPAFSAVQPLSCFSGGPLQSDRSTGTLNGPSGTFNCTSRSPCGAAMYMAQNPEVVDRLLKALHPAVLDEKAAGKRENDTRRKALKELRHKGVASFRAHLYCRGLGDAYFAAMCPAGSVVLTTNLQDHEPLCSALGKKAVEP